MIRTGFGLSHYQLGYAAMMLRANIWSFRAVQCRALFVQLAADQIKYLVALNFGSVVYASIATKVLRSFLVCVQVEFLGVEL